MSKRPNPKILAKAERIASVELNLRQHLISENARGVGMKPLAKLYGIPEKTVRVIIHDSKLPAPMTAVKPRQPEHTDLWHRPDLWRRYGVKGPYTPKMVTISS